MKLADKPCYPRIAYLHKNEDGDYPCIYEDDGLTFRERLIIALASNPAVIMTRDERLDADRIKQVVKYEETSVAIRKQADAIIKEMEDKK